MLLHFKFIGILLIVLALVHAIFPWYFKWKEELPRLSLINHQMMEVHTLFVAVTVFLMGCLCWSEATALVSTTLGKQISLGFALFWSLRLWLQFFGYSSKLWKGKVFETIVHICFIVLWSYLSFIFWYNYLY